MLSDVDQSMDERHPHVQGLKIFNRLEDLAP